MTYAAESDLEEYFGTEYLLIAADRDGDGVADTDVISTAITAAEEEIDSYVGVRYTLPLSATPGVLKRLCCNLAMYHMSVGHISMSEEKETRYNAGVKWLEKLSKGVVTLGVEEEQVETNDHPSIASATATTSETRRFTRTKMGNLL